MVGSGGTSTGTSYQTNNHDGNGSRSTSWNRNNNWSMQARKLLKPEEVVALPERTAITFTNGVPPIATTLVRYYESELRTGRLRIHAEVWLAAILLLGSLLVIGVQAARFFSP